MFITTNEFHNFDATKLYQFLELKIPEGIYIDYKLDISSIERGKAYKEFLKDVTAFANAGGGNIVIGAKEPSDAMDIGDQVLGIENGDQIAQNLERLSATSIDPRVSGLGIKAIPLSNSRYIVLVHIPPSMNRPHMVNYDSHRSFYMRHSESSFPMTTYEIKQSVMASFSAEETVKAYFHLREADILSYFLDATPTFILQAMPLISLESSWNVLDEKIEKIVRGTSGNSSSYIYELASSIAPQPTLDGLRGQGSRDKPDWVTEVHRNGYISVVFKNQSQCYEKDNESYLVHSGSCLLFSNFMEFVEKLTDATNTDLPYIISCKYYGAKMTRLATKKLWDRFTKPYYKDEIIFPLHYRMPGQPFEEIADILSGELFNAFGLKEVTE